MRQSFFLGVLLLTGSAAFASENTGVEFATAKIERHGAAVELTDKGTLDLMLPERITFEYDSSSVEQNQTITALAAFLEILPETYYIRITGHSDAEGTDAYNKRLGLERAISVMRQLIMAGIPHERLIVRTQGESSLLVPESDRRRLNRRIDIELLQQAVNLDF